MESICVACLLVLSTHFCFYFTTSAGAGNTGASGLSSTISAGIAAPGTPATQVEILKSQLLLNEYMN